MLTKVVLPECSVRMRPNVVSGRRPRPSLVRGFSSAGTRVLVRWYAGSRPLITDRGRIPGVVPRTEKRRDVPASLFSLVGDSFNNPPLGATHAHHWTHCRRCARLRDAARTVLRHHGLPRRVDRW